MALSKSTRDKENTNQVYENFFSYLKAYKRRDDEEITHTSMGTTKGSFTIPDSETTEFLEKYVQALEAGCDLGIVSRTRSIGPLKIDIDIHSKVYDERQYTADHIKQVVRCANSIINETFDSTNKIVKNIVCEKSKPTYSGNSMKDGFHVEYPYLITTHRVRYYILHKLQEKLENLDTFNELEPTNSMSDIIDRAVVIRNGWMMYGSKKPDGLVYKYSYYFNSKLENMRYNQDFATLVNKLYNRHEYDRPIELAIDEEEIEKIADIYEKRKKPVTESESYNDSSDSEEYNQEVSKDYPNITMKRFKKKCDSKMAKKLVNLLSNSRAGNYNDWINVGWALHNIGDDLYETWIQFSKRDKTKFNKDECDKIWSSARTEGYTISSLHWWAKQDNPDEHKKLIRIENQDLIMMAINSQSNFDIAKLIHTIYKPYYKCTSLKNKSWYEFNGQRWVPMDRAYSLNILMSEDLPSQLWEMNKICSEKMSKNVNNDTEHNTDKVKATLALINKLKHTTFKNAVMEQCMNLFYDPTFESKLDSNIELLGFENGVYDLENKVFRSGLPDDNISKTLGYNYDETYTIDHPVVKRVMKHFEQVQTELDMREYVLMLVSSYLDGHNRDQKFILWTGTGANGKSVTIELIQNTLGDYFSPMDTTVLTRKKKSSSEATPEMADKAGVRLVVFQEPEEDDKINVGYMKQLSGSDWINARQLYKEQIRFKPQFKMLLVCNKLPYVPSSDGGTWRRIRVVSWDSKFVDEDHPDINCPRHFKKIYSLDTEMATWKEAFMWLLINVYYKKYKSNGLKEPEKVKIFTKDYEKNSDIIKNFIDDRLENNVDKMTPEEASKIVKLKVIDIFADYKEWMKQTNCVFKTPPLADFTSGLITKGIVNPNNRHYLIQGIKIKAQDDENEGDDMM